MLSITDRAASDRGQEVLLVLGKPLVNVLFAPKEGSQSSSVDLYNLHLLLTIGSLLQVLRHLP